MMRRSVAIAVVLLAVVGAGQARGERRIAVTGMFGIRTFSEVSVLGAPTATSLANSVIFGVRASRPIRSWLVAEAELPVLVTGTRDDAATVFYFEPRVHAVFEAPRSGRIQPFGVAGAGAPIALSSDRPRFASDLQPEGYLGIGARFERATGWSVRVDARVLLLPGRDDHALAPELEFSLSLYRRRTLARSRGPVETVEAPPSDLDGDGIVDQDDRCPRRAEDLDGFEDADGCPDIDDDRDEVLDIADQCRLDAETWNGFQDDDGCPDVIPEAVLAVAGVLEGVGFARDAAALDKRGFKVLDQVAAVLVQYPSVRGRIVVVSEGGERSAGGEGDEEADGEGGAQPNVGLDLAQARADAIKYYLVARGVSELRIGAVGVDAGGGEEAGMVVRRWLAEFQIRRRETR